MGKVEIIRIILIITFLTTFISVFYYSWLPNPSFKTERYLPNLLIQWTEEHGIIRTGVPFVLLSINAIFLNLKTLTLFKIFLILFVLLLLAESGQLLLKYRHFDLKDIFAGTAGIIIGLGIGLELRRIFNPKVKEI